MKKTLLLTLLVAFVLSFGVFAAMPAHAADCCSKSAAASCDKAACDKCPCKGGEKCKCGKDCKCPCCKDGKCTKPAAPAPTPSK
jgi:hypothetical protein